MAVNHPYTYGPTFKTAYISYDANNPCHRAPWEREVKCDHVFINKMTLIGDTHYPTGFFRCEKCGVVKSGDWVWAWQMTEGRSS